MPIMSVELLCQKARQAVEQRDWEKARDYYQQALALNPNSADVHYGLATICFQARDYAGAAQHFREVTRVDPARAGAFINLGALYNILEQYDDAIVALRRAIQLDPQRAESYYNLGLVHKRKGQLDMAVHAYREAIRVDSRMADAHYNLANIFLDREQYNQAFAHYKQALELRPNWDKAITGLTQAEEALAEQNQQNQEASERIDEAADLATQAATLDPDKVLDPVAHGDILNLLHRATIDAENNERDVLKVIEEDLEPAIKELSSCLLYPSSTAHELQQCLDKFEAAAAKLQIARKSLQGNMEKVRNLGNRLVENA